MKHLILAAMLLAPAVNASEPTKQDLCKSFATYAETVMTARQNGATLVKMLDIAADSEIAQAIIIDAYQSPSYSTDKYKTNAAVEFSNKVLLTCLKVAQND
jgi:3-hydroxyisobutyrate dehydrogenase-like beta-hydroxyacid dehydrogenase